MNRRRGVPVLVVGLVVCLSPAAAVAQSDKASVRRAPQPGQSVRMTLDQEMDFDLSIEGAPPGLDAMKMLTRITMALTQKTGPRKADGTVDAVLTYDEFRTETSMNGQTMPRDAGDQLIGKPVTVTYGRDGSIVSVKGLPPGGVTDDAFKQMMGSLVGNLPTTELKVGETTTVPMDLELPFPLPGAGPLQMRGDTRITLVSIDKDAQGRSARFDSTVNGTMVSDVPSPDGMSTLTLEFTMDGGGTTVVDLDKGLARSNESSITVHGRIGMPAGAAPAGVPPTLTMRGTITLTMTSK